jgi:DNA polymerase-3 subunit gamma/tau
MASQVYYRKWRPQRLAEVVGQEPVIQTLKQALVQNRVAHAYLFCGPRGTGKTSTARILAKAVNCLSPNEDGEPDTTCHICESITEGRSLDLIEIDAASNRGIDEIRSLREKVRFAPNESAYKVYILDEAHMLTEYAADALLKTLEEPPPHVKFILATTDPHRLPSTITSRCQRFDFRRISPNSTKNRLTEICDAEGIKTDPEVLNTITRGSQGSLRDAENLLEQVVTSYGNTISLEQIRLLLGLSDDDRPRILVGHLFRRETAQALILINSVSMEGFDLQQFHRQVVQELRDLLLLKAGASEMLDQPADVTQAQTSLVKDVKLEQVLRILGLLAQVTFSHDTPQTLPLELAVVESAQEAVASHIDKNTSTTLKQPQISKSIATPPPTSVAPISVATERPRPILPTPEQNRLDPSPVPSLVTNQPDPLPPISRDEPWEEMIRTLSRLKGRRFNLGALLRACRHHHLEGDKLTLNFTHRSHMERMQEEMDYPESKRVLQEAITIALGTSSELTLSYTAENSEQGLSQENDSPLVKAALNMGGKIVDQEDEMSTPNSTRSREDE